MDVSPASPSDPTVGFDGPERFRVRHVVSSQGGWLVDDYDVSGATDVQEVIAWAEAAFTDGQFQVYLRYEVMQEGPDGWGPEPHFAHLHGAVPDTGVAHETETFTAQ